MSERFDQLHAKHSNLRALCAVQRLHLAEQAQEIESHLGRIDRGVTMVRKVARNPMLIVGGIAIVGLLGPRRLFGWAARGALFYSTAKRALGMVREPQ